MAGWRCQPAALAPTDHGLDDVAENPACGRAVAQFARAFKVFPGNLERFLKQLGKRDGHGRKTNQNRARSMSSPLRGPVSFLDRNPLGPKNDIAENVVHDEIIVFEVMAETLDALWWKSYRLHLER